MWYLYEPKTGNVYGPFDREEDVQYIVDSTDGRYEAIFLGGTN